MKKSIIAFILTLCLLTSFPVASGTAALPASIGIIEAQAASVKLNKSKLTMIKGQTYTLKISGTKKKVKWSSSKKSVATVSSKGKVTAKKKGTATISAKIGSKTYKCKITVEKPSISKTKANLVIGKTTTLSVKNTKQKVSWKSSNTKVATVDSKGKVKGIKKGTATITATVGSLKKKYTCKVKVDTAKAFEFNKLEDYINKHGDFDKYGDLYIEDVYTTGSGTVESLRIYLKKDRMTFVLSSLYSDDAYSYMDVTLEKYSNTAYTYYEYYEDIDNVNPNDIADVSFDATKWNDNTLLFNIVDSTLNPEYYYLTQNLANATLKVLMCDSSLFLAENGFSINKLGFSAYETL